MLFKVIYVRSVIISLFSPPSLPFIVYIPSVASFEGYILEKQILWFSQGSIPPGRTVSSGQIPLHGPQLLLQSEKQLYPNPFPLCSPPPHPSSSLPFPSTLAPFYLCLCSFLLLTLSLSRLLLQRNPTHVSIANSSPIRASAHVCAC